jgi:hypothetical protein
MRKLYLMDELWVIVKKKGSVAKNQNILQNQGYSYVSCHQPQSSEHEEDKGSSANILRKYSFTTWYERYCHAFFEVY